MKSVLSVENLSVLKPGSEEVLLHVPQMEFTSDLKYMLMGPSGSGKSCFLKSIAQLHPSVGDVELNQKKAENHSPEEFRAQVMYLSQSPFFIEGSVEENLRWPFTWKVFKHLQYRGETAIDLINSLGWSTELLTKNHKQLSGGEKQIMHLLRSLLLKPKFLLLDEPTSSLDAKLSEKLEELIHHLASAENIGIIWSTHSKEQAQKLGDRQLVIEKGTIKILN